MKGDREQTTDRLGEWWADGTELAARMQALAEWYRSNPVTIRQTQVADDIEQVLSREWNPRDGTGVRRG